MIDKTVWENGKATSIVLRWLFDQGLPTILLFTLLGVCIYGVRSLIPEHIKAIQEGYERIEDKHVNEVRDLIETFDRDQERDHQWMERMINGGVNGAAIADREGEQ